MKFGGPAFLLVVMFFLVSGCVERLMVIKSEPKGAKVYIDGKLVGKTPVETRFKWYGSVNMIVEKPEYKTVEKIEDLPIPWFQVFPLSVITSVFVPWQIYDKREFNYKLSKYSLTDDIEELKKGLQRAKDKLSE